MPLVVAISTTIGARNGLLVRDRRGLEEARNVTTVVFDKTGTLTLGEHRVVAIKVAEGINDAEALRLAAALEQDAEHSVAKAILKTAAERLMTIPTASEFHALPGYGVQAVVEGRHLSAGGPNLLKKLGAEPLPALRTFADEAATRGEGVIYLEDMKGAGPLTGSWVSSP